MYKSTRMQRLKYCISDILVISVKPKAYYVELISLPLLELHLPACEGKVVLS